MPLLLAFRHSVVLCEIRHGPLDLITHAAHGFAPASRRANAQKSLCHMSAARVAGTAKKDTGLDHGLLSLFAANDLLRLDGLVAILGFSEKHRDALVPFDLPPFSLPVKNRILRYIITPSELPFIVILVGLEQAGEPVKDACAVRESLTGSPVCSTTVVEDEGDH